MSTTTENKTAADIQMPVMIVLQQSAYGRIEAVSERRVDRYLASGKTARTQLIPPPPHSPQGGRCRQYPSSTRHSCAQEHAPELGEPVGRVVECAEDAFSVLDRQGDDRRLANVRRATGKADRQSSREDVAVDVSGAGGSSHKSRGSKSCPGQGVAKPEAQISMIVSSRTDSSSPSGVGFSFAHGLLALATVILAVLAASGSALDHISRPRAHSRGCQ
jgi:hypothetical protein